MRITIVQGPFLPVPPLLGGAVEKVWYELGKEFAKHGHEVTHISRKYDSLPEREYIADVEHIRVSGFNSTKYFYLNLALDFIYAINVYRVLPVSDILVTNTFSLPLLIRTKKYGALYVHVARRPKGQLFLYRHASRIQTVSEAIKNDILKQVPGLTAVINYIPNPLTHNVIKSEFKGIIDNKENLILYVGRLHPEKGVDLLVKAFEIFNKSHHDWMLYIVGPYEVSHGGGGAKYINRLYDLSINFKNKIKFIGPVFDDTELEQYYRRAKIFVYPSLAEHGETFGLAPLEAMSFGCTPIVSNLNCFQEYIKNGITGYVFDHREQNVEVSLANLLMEIISNPNRLNISTNCYHKAITYSIDNISKQYINDFKQILEP